MNDKDLSLIRMFVDQLIEQHPLPEGLDHACPYLPGLTARGEGFQIDSMDPVMIAAFLDRGFRRSGRVIYRPVCPNCSACIPLRIPVRRFRMTRSMRRVWRANRDLRVEVGAVELSDEKLDLYARYLEHQHDGTMTGTPEEFANFLCRSPVETIEFRYCLGRRLLGVGVADRCPGALSSVYMYFDPEHRRRSLGTYSVLYETRYCADHGLDYYHLGYYVAGSGKMNYKARFKPCQALRTDGAWEPFDEPVPSTAGRDRPPVGAG